MDFLMQSIVVAAFIAGILIVVGLSLFFLALPYEWERTGIVLDADEEAAPIS